MIGESLKNAEDIQKFLELNKNESTTYQDLWDTTKAVFRRKFTYMNAYIKNTERFQINDNLHLKLLKNKNS
jgi:hypothetical protein